MNTKLVIINSFLIGYNISIHALRVLGLYVNLLFAYYVSVLNMYRADNHPKILKII